MRGLSITAIGLRPIEDCIAIYRTLQPELGLEYLELAIGSACELWSIPEDIPLVLHNSCLYEYGKRQRFDLLDEDTWLPYRRCVEQRNVLAISIHPPKRSECSLGGVDRRREALESYLGVPTMIEVMPSREFWYSADCVGDGPLLLDVSHINIWCRGDYGQVEACVRSLVPQSGGIHLSHNNGRRDSHDLIPEGVWFEQYVNEWADKLLVTYESLPARWAEYERMDKQRGGRMIR